MKTRSKTRPWDDIEAGLKPAVLEEAQQLLHEDLESMLLAEIRKIAGLTQAELAERLGIRQSAVSQIERQDDLQISTLRRIVEALGGELEITARLPTGRITVAPFSGRAA